MPEQLPRVVIVGGGFGGLAAAKAPRRPPVEVILIDRNNHHVFMPLLYQVATGVLAPGQVGYPIRGIVGRHKNTTVLLAEVTGVNKEEHYVIASSTDRRGVAIHYDYLVLATGQSHSYFGHDEFATFAPGLKTLADAVTVRNRVLQAFEQAVTARTPVLKESERPRPRKTRASIAISSPSCWCGQGPPASRWPARSP